MSTFKNLEEAKQFFMKDRFATENGIFEGYIDLYVSSKDILEKMIKKISSITRSSITPIGNRVTPGSASISISIPN